jgi:hypothetical protein
LGRRKIEKPKIARNITFLAFGESLAAGNVFATRGLPAQTDKLVCRYSDFSELARHAE